MCIRDRITGQFVKKLKIYKEKGLELQGLEDYTGRKIKVVRQENLQDKPDIQNL